MQMMVEDGAIGVQMGGGGPSGRMAFGDYVMSERKPKHYVDLHAEAGHPKRASTMCWNV